MKKRIKDSLGIKIFLITSLLLILTCALIYGFISYSMPISYQFVIKNDIKEQIKEATKELSQVTLQECDDILKKLSLQINSEVTILNENGDEVKKVEDGENKKKKEHYIEEIVVTSIESDKMISIEEIYKMPISSALWSSNVVEESNEDTNTMSWGINFYFSDFGEEYILIIQIESQKMNEVQRALLKLLPWLSVAILLVSILGSYVYSFYITKPIIKISRIANQMARLEFDFQCDEKRKDEIGILGKSLNELSQRLSIALNDLKNTNLALEKDIENERKLEKKRKEFFSAVSHELKTPITIIKGQLEGMLYKVGVYKDTDTYLKKALNVVEQMEGMVKEILVISRIESNEAFTKRREIDFTKLLEKETEKYLELMERKQQQLRFTAEKGLKINMEEALLKHVFSNLYSNAVSYSPEFAEIRVSAQKKEKQILFSIENTGVTIPKEDLDRLTDAFYRIEQSRNRKTGGSGLGLYIVKTILEREKAIMKIENTKESVKIEIFFT